MKKILFVPLALCLSIHALAQDNQNSASDKKMSGSPSPNTVQIYMRPEIAGLWGMQIPNNKKCTEYYNFKSNNNLIVNSGAEWSTGFYEYQPSLNPEEQLSVLTIHVQYDNNQVDCSGNKVDQADEVSQYYVKWTDPKSFQLCSIEQAGKCFSTLRRILP